MGGVYFVLESDSGWRVGGVNFVRRLARWPFDGQRRSCLFPVGGRQAFLNPGWSSVLDVEQAVR